jgi:hypothetical protein
LNSESPTRIPTPNGLALSGLGAAKPTLRFYADASAATRSVCNAWFGGTSPPMLPNLGIAMEMDDAKEYDLVELVDELQTVGESTDLCHAHPHFSLLKHEWIFGNSSHRSIDLK